MPQAAGHLPGTSALSVRSLQVLIVLLIVACTHCGIYSLSMAMLTMALLTAAHYPLWKVMLVCLVLVAPLLWLLLLTVLWATPLRATSQRGVLLAAERCFAWAALDVFMLTILAGLSQVRAYAHAHAHAHAHAYAHAHARAHAHASVVY